MGMSERSVRKECKEHAVQSERGETGSSFHTIKHCIDRECCRNFSIRVDRERDGRVTDFYKGRKEIAGSHLSSGAMRRL